MDSPNDLIRPRRALISTFDKTGLLPLCEVLRRARVEIISTGNTARFLQENGIPVMDVEKVTGFPEILNGRVKTLHPHIFSGVLARRNLPAHMETLNSHHISPIDLVIVNLYPFEKTMGAHGATESDCIEHIDIGGPSLLRAAAKNFDHVTVLCDPSQYDEFISKFSVSFGTDIKDRRLLAAAAFSKTAQYDDAISTWFSGNTLRYGENPHQKAQVLVNNDGSVPLANAIPLQGKELSYNNLMDAHAAILAVRCLMSKHPQSKAGCVIVKHGTPCGAALRKVTCEAASAAFASDPVSAFGGIVALSTTVDEATAAELKGHFLELVIAPHFDDQARAILSAKKDLRLVELPTLLTSTWPAKSTRSIFGGTLIQEFDTPDTIESEQQVVSKKKPSLDDIDDLQVANQLVIPCLSNAITIVKHGQLIGVGAGQTSRIDAVKLAIAKAREHGHDLVGAVLASDGFFPFADSLEVAKAAGITSIIQPGGSKRDSEVIAKSDELELAMIFTHTRHFRH